MSPTPGQKNKTSAFARSDLSWYRFWRPGVGTSFGHHSNTEGRFLRHQAGFDPGGGRGRVVRGWSIHQSQVVSGVRLGGVAAVGGPANLRLVRIVVQRLPAVKSCPPCRMQKPGSGFHSTSGSQVVQDRACLSVVCG